MLYYKIDILQELKKNGFSTYKLRKDKLIGEKQLQAIRNKSPIHWTTIEKLCDLLNCQPDYIIGNKKEP